MSTVAKILVVVNLVLAGAFLASAASFLGHDDHWKVKHDQDVDSLTAKINGDKQKDKDGKDEMGTNGLPIRKGGLTADIVKLGEEKTNLTASLQLLRETVAGAQAQATAATGQNDLLKGQIESLGASLTSATRALEAAQLSLQANRTLIDTLQTERQTHVTALGAALEQKDAAKRLGASLQASLNSETENRKGSEAQLADAMEKIKRLQFELETWKAKFPGAEVPTGQPAQEGRVLAADNGANVVVISLGEEDGVRPGFKYIVSRGSSYVTTIEITDAEVKKSAGRSIIELQKMPVKAGDVVMTR